MDDAAFGRKGDRIKEGDQRARRAGRYEGDLLAGGDHGRGTVVRAEPSPRKIRVAIVEEHEILRRGLVSCFLEEPFVPLSAPGSGERVREEADVAVVSSDAAQRYEFSCPVVVCSDQPQGPQGLTAGNDVAGVIHPSSVTVAELLATVRAAAAGLRISPNGDAADHDQLDSRSLRLLELVAEGLTTREIAAQLSYSEQTIKKLIIALEGRMAARSRAQMVAMAIRRRLI